MKNPRKTFMLLAIGMLAACGGGDDNNASSNSGGNGGDNGGSTPTGTLPKLTPARALAFPGADGGASAVTGGAECDVVVVTSLADDNSSGTLRSALSMGKRTIVFAVGGQINLTRKLEISASDITIAGHSAPGDGITIAGYPVFIKGSNIILRYLRFRMGDQNIDNANFDADDGDALGAKDCRDILIDHCSISWSTDECASFSRVENLTVQYCIISESLKLSGHSKGNHGYGGIWGGRNASYHHNLLAHHDSRNPRFDHSYVGKTYRGPIDYVNNVVYNWGGNTTYGGETDAADDVFHINMVGNYYKPGPSSKNKNRLMQLTSHCTNCVKSSGDAYPANLFLEDNTVNGANASWDNIDMDGSSETRDKTQLKSNARLASRWTTGLTALSFTESASDAYNTVLACAGASLRRDAVDERIVANVKSGGGALIDKVSDTPGYPTLAAGSPLTDTDKDGMPDEWELQQMKAMNVDNIVYAFKPNAYNLSAKYTNLEVYLNSLVTATFPAGAGAGNTR